MEHSLKENAESVEKTNKDDGSSSPARYFLLNRRYPKIVIAFLLFIIFLRVFVFQAYKIPSGSMENTLLSGDYILVNKFVFGFSDPLTIPFINLQIPVNKIPAIWNPSRFDVIVFHFPGTAVDYNSNGLNYIKRVVGMPGDTLQIVDGSAYINGKMIEGGYLNISGKSKNRITKHEKIFPANKPWDENFYGPVVIPKRGAKINITPENIFEYETIIDRESGKKNIEIKNEKVYLDGILTEEYEFKLDYYFALGDNRDDSLDSRYWGFVPRNFIIGKAVLIYWSADPLKEGITSKIRFDRILKSIN
ncbi:MAG: signal peptidase I [Ignavibacteriaceae bacterium]|nr:signal peptidase I [Ignavibacteriaceae bacterium]